MNLDDLLEQGRQAVLPVAGTVVDTVAQRIGCWRLDRPDRVPGQEPPLGYYRDEAEQLAAAAWDNAYRPPTRWD